MTPVVVEAGGNILDTLKSHSWKPPTAFMQRDCLPAPHSPGLQGDAGHSAQAASRTASLEWHLHASSGTSQDI